MNNKILIGSIIAVAILVLVSFTGVVGYQTTKSSTIAKASPLFSIRSKRAIDEESKDLTCAYVGKGEEITIPIPTRDSRNAFLQKFIDRVSKMDDEAFDKFIGLVINRLEKEPNINDETISEIVKLLEQLRNEPMKPANYKIFRINSNEKKSSSWYDSYCETTGCDGCWTPPISLFVIGCFIMLLLIFWFAFLILTVSGHNTCQC